MTKTSRRAARTKCFRIAFAASLAAGSLHGAELKEGHVTQIIKDVKLLPGQAEPRPAVVNDPVRAGTAVRTGTDSRTELTFSDLTIARLGANTIFSLNEGTRTIGLGGGAILVRVPKDSGGAKITTSAVTAAITGTTMLAEYHKDSIYKFIMLEGQSRITRAGHPEESVILHGGEMLSGDPRKPLGTPVTVDVKKIIESSQLIQDFGPLGSEALIAAVIAQQEALSNFPNRIFALGTDDLNTLDQRIAVEQTSAPPGPPPPPPKFGPLEIITSANLSIIDTATAIQTDPTITRNGETGFGRIYRGPEVDGPASAYAFGSTSGFDVSSGFDSQIDSSGAVFKFTSLQLNGAPMISTTDGEINLGLIAVNGITSGSSPGTLTSLTFAGIRGLLLATQNGSINIGAGFSFSGLHDLTFYARGAGSNLTLASSISTTDELRLYSEGNVNLSGNVSTRDFSSNSIGDFNLTSASFNAETISIVAATHVSIGGNAPFHTTNFFLQALGSVQVTDSLVVTQSAGDTSGGLNITLHAFGNMTVGDDLRLTTEVSGLLGGGNIDLSVGANLTVGGLLSLMTSSAGASGNFGGRISVLVGDTLRAGDIFLGGDFAVSFPQGRGEDVILQAGEDLLVHDGENSGGIRLEVITPVRQTVADGANITLNVGGDLATDTGGETSFLINNNINEVVNGANVLAHIFGDLLTGDFSAELTNESGTIGTGGNLTLDVRGDLTTSSFLAHISNTDGGSIGTGGNIVVTVGGDATGSDVDATIDNSGEGSIATGGNITLSIGGGLSAGALNLQIDNSNGGTIGTGGNLFITVGGNLAADFIDAAIQNRDGGSIGSSANITFNLNGALTTTAYAEFRILNFAGELTNSGTIGGNATINVAAASISVGQMISFINDVGGNIGGDAGIIFSLSGDLTSSNPANFEIYNNEGTIGGDAAVNVTAANISVPESLRAAIDNGSGGHIGGNASIVFDLSGGLTSSDQTTFQIDNRNGGSIGGDAKILFDVVGDIASQGGVSFEIVNLDDDSGSGGTIGGDALINVLAGGVDAGSLLHIDIFNGGGQIGGSAAITVGGENFSAGSLSAQIDNSGGGLIGARANITFDVTGALTTGDAVFQIQNNDGGHIGTDANISVTTGGDFAADSIEALINNRNGGSIDSGGSITFNVGGALTTAGDAIFVTSNRNDGAGGGRMDSDVALNLSASSVSVGGAWATAISTNGGGHINGNAFLGISVAGDVTIQGDMAVRIENSYITDVSGGGSIGADATIGWTANNLSIAGFLESAIWSHAGGTIGGDATLSIIVADAFHMQNDALIYISTLGEDISQGAGSIGGDALINVLAGSVNTGELLDIDIFNGSGQIGGNAAITLAVSNDISVATDALFRIFNNDPGNESGGGMIGDNALITVAGENFTAGSLLAKIDNRDGGSIGDNASINFDLGGALNSTGDAEFQILNFSDGTIGGDAVIDVSAASITANSLLAQIDNGSGGNIGGNANINFNLAGDLTTQGDASFLIDNFGDIKFGGGGTIGGDAAISVTAANIGAGSLLAQIDNSNGGTIGGDATIDMDVSGSATITSDATVQILGSDGAAAAAININGGSYEAGGTFLAFVDGNGTITFNNASVHADVLKVGVFGTNGVLTIGGGTLSGDTTLKLYAPGSNGMINFVSNVTLNSDNSRVIIAGNTVTINNGVVVTITGNDGVDASVFTNIPNYTGSGGNGSTSGIFAGNGANTQPLAQAPPFDNPPRPPASVAPGGNIASGKRRGGVINVNSTDHLLALLDGAVPGPGGKIAIPASRTTSSGRNAGQINAPGRLSAGRRTVDIQTASLLPNRRLAP